MNSHEIDDIFTLKSHIQKMKFYKLPIDLVMVKKNKGSQNIIYTPTNSSY